MTNFDLDKHTWRLLQNEPFFAALSRRIHKTPTTAIPTAGVKLNKHTAQFEMIYNPEFFEKLEDNHKLGVFMHEYYHIIFEHVTGRLPPEGMNIVWNIATDLAINSHLKGMLPEGCCMPEEDRFKDYPAGKSAEWYYAKLKQEQKDQQDQQDGDGEAGDGGGQGGGDLADHQFDNHDGWVEADEDTKQMAKERLRQAVEDAAKEASNKGSWGTMSSQMRQKIMDMITPKVDWRKVLRYFIKTSAIQSTSVLRFVVSSKDSLISMLERRLLVRPRLRSLSTSRALSLTRCWLRSLRSLWPYKYAEFTVVPFDTEVGEEHVFVWKKGKSQSWDRVMCGGTCFNAPTKWVNDRGFDGHIVLTDMCAPKPIPSKCQRMWMTDSENVIHTSPPPSV